MKKTSRILYNCFLAIILIIISYGFLRFSCGGNTDKEKAKDIEKKQYVKTIVDHIIDQKEQNGYYPRQLDHNNCRKYAAGKKYIKGTLYYNPNGINDIKGNIWIIIFKDKNNRFFAGNAKTIRILPETEFQLSNLKELQLVLELE